MEPSPEQRSQQRKGRIIITLIFLSFSVGVWILLSLGTPYVQSLRKHGVMGQVFYTVEEVLSGDTLRVRHEDTTYIVKLAGIEAPHPTWLQNPDLKEFAWSAQDLAQLAGTSRKALSTWIYTRQLALHPAPAIGEEATDQPLVVRATLSKVDLGRKQLQAGQARMTQATHDWNEIYEISQAEAVEAGHGLWRYQPKTP